MGERFLGDGVRDVVEEQLPYVERCIGVPSVRDGLLPLSILVPDVAPPLRR